MNDLTIASGIKISYDGYNGLVVLDTANNFELCMTKENLVGLHNCAFNGTAYKSKARPTILMSKTPNEVINIEVELSGDFEVTYYEKYFTLYQIDDVAYRNEYFSVEQCNLILKDAEKYEGHIALEKDFMD